MRSTASPPIDALLRLVATAALLSSGTLLASCARVQQKDREYLSDPVMLRAPDPLESMIEGDNFPRREGSSGGSSGAGGGCGC